MKTVLIMLAALPLLAADAAGGHFSGRVFDQSSKQIADAIVTVTTPSGYISSVVTSKAGGFSFNALPPGEYDFRVTAHGFAIYERKVTVASEGGVRELDIRMLVPANKQTVSVAELQNPNVTSVGAAAGESMRRGY